MSLAFLYPWVLSLLLALPFIYWLLRIMPPTPQKIVIPTIRFLRDLPQDTPPTHSIPPWLLILRLLLLALLIIGLAQPVLNPQEKLSGSGPVVIILDNGWSAARNWSELQSKTLELLNRAKQSNRPVKLILTAPDIAEPKIPESPLTSAEGLITQIKGLTPQAWPTKPDLAAAELKTLPDDSADIYWISSGLADQNYRQVLEAAPNAKVILPDAARLPILLRPPLEDKDQTEIARLEAPAGSPPQSIQVRANTSQGKLIDQIEVEVTGGKGYIAVHSQMPEADLQSVSRLQLAGLPGAGHVLLKNSTQLNPKIGLVSSDSEDVQFNITQPGYYISRAVEPFAEFSAGRLETLLEKQVGIIVLAEGGNLTVEQLNTLTKWIEAGGILLRFADAALVSNPDPLTPVPLRQGERSLEGDMTWDKPQTVKSINPNSPFANLALPTDISIRRQLLAEPVSDLADKSWVTLSDDTPLITASYKGRGLMVLVHTTASPDWSDLPLSGFYVEIFKHLQELTKRSVKSATTETTLKPLRILDGFGQFVAPPANLNPLTTAELDKASVSSMLPPGIYGSDDDQVAVNLGDRLPPLESLKPHLQEHQIYTAQGKLEKPLAPLVLSTCLILFIADLMILVLLGGWLLKIRTLVRQTNIFVIVIVFALASLLPAVAAAAEKDEDLASQIRLAYIQTGDSEVDATTQRGLERISQALIDRTAIEAGKVMAVKPGQDNLAFYPLIYWPISQSQPQLSEAANAALQDYLDHGGMILLDTRAGRFHSDDLSPSDRILKMRQMVSGLSLKPLAPAPSTHVIFKSFYLLALYPEMTQANELWIEEDALEEFGQVSSVVVTGRDWARLWAATPGTLPNQQQEESIRFAVNMVMYAVTGNYKADQIHMQAILKRLGQ